MLENPQTQMKYLITIVFCVISTLLFAQETEINSLKFTGLQRTRPAFLNRLVKVKLGTTYDSLKVATDIARLNRLPGIAKASVQDSIGIDGRHHLTYDVVENFTIIPGLRISEANDESFAFRVSLFEFNFLGRGQIIGGFYQRDVFDSFGGYWEAPFLFTNKLGLGMNYIRLTTFEPIYYDDGAVNYNKQNNGGEVYGIYEIDFQNKVELGVKVYEESYEFEDARIDSNRPNNLRSDKVAIRGEHEFLKIDIDYQYFSGFANIFDGRYILGGEGLLEEGAVLKNTTAYFKRVGEKGNWASRLQLGLASFNDSEFAPFTIDNQFNLRGAGNDIARGTAFTSINTEYRHTLLEKGWFVIQGNVFTDLGSWRSPRGTFDELASINNIQAYSGVGVRFIHKRIFNAVVRVDYGIGWGATKNNGVVFGIGQYF